MTNQWDMRSKLDRKDYMQNASALYGDATPARERQPRQQNVTQSFEPTEDMEQIRLVAYMNKHNIPHFHIPNQRQTSLAYGAKLKAMGVQRGMSDICVPVAKGIYHHLYIELKRKVGGVVSQYQKDWLEKLNRLGSLAVVAHGADEAIDKIEHYLQLDG